MSHTYKQTPAGSFSEQSTVSGFPFEAEFVFGCRGPALTGGVGCRVKRTSCQGEKGGTVIVSAQFVYFYRWHLMIRRIWVLEWVRAPTSLCTHARHCFPHHRQLCVRASAWARRSAYMGIFLGSVCHSIHLSRSPMVSDLLLSHYVSIML